MFEEVKLTRSLLLRAKMAQRGLHLDRNNLFCSICLDLLKDPVTIPCGHSYCMNCIKEHWDGEDQRRIQSCPQCRKTFRQRPALLKNIMLPELVEDLKKTVLQAAPTYHCYAKPKDVACDVCTGRKRKAVKFCLICLASYCDSHLQTHYSAPPLKKHKLVNPSKDLQENICSRHDEVMKIFCRTDQQCICYLCSMDEHKGHETVPAAAEKTEKQKELQVSRQQIQQRIQDQEKDLKLLQQEVEAINVSADRAVKDSEKIFTEMIRLIQKRRSDVKQQIRSQQETEVSRVKDLQEKLEQEITELKRKDAEMKQLSKTEDHNQFFHNYPSLSALSESTHSSSINIRPLRYFEDVTAAVSELRDKLQDILRDTWTNISLTITEVDVLLLRPKPKTRADFLKYFQHITLDPHTAYKHLFLSEENRRAALMKQQQSYPDHPERFIDSKQVLSRESLTGRCYWEVEWKGGGVKVAVSYHNISRAGNSHKCAFGFNDKSWALHCDSNSYTFYHNNIKTPVSGPVSSRIGVYLDHRAGILSFYSVSETMTLLHRVQTTFTQPLHAGIQFFYYYFYYSGGDTAEFIKL
ncbi:tripartite motif-containing protein 16-like [Girardinichthys multiradiatus]|uniref:tripartite motif-containing protein 16-like n=1 Tax=Girardinichthys multiradiatus TaxID=208333 RepID=UPI001FAC1795|nr:tripartite motif-containing protein 16-like [Girardinichthys multiradiatus]